MLCVPPESITSASPRRINSRASPMAWLLAAHAVRQLALGPCASNMLARCPAGILGSCSSSPTGLRISMPFFTKAATSSFSSSPHGSQDHLSKGTKILLPFAAPPDRSQSVWDQRFLPHLLLRRLVLPRPAAKFECRPRLLHTVESSPSSAISQSRTSAENFVGNWLASKAWV